MRTIVVYLGLALFVSFSVSCEPKMTLQRYFYQAQENGDIMLFELPTSLLGQSFDGLSQEQIETLKSVRKLSALVYRDSLNSQFANEQRVIINGFLARDGFEPLFAAQMTDEAQVAIHIQGSIDEVKEAVFFGYADDQGFVLARIMGKDMDPAAFLALAKSLDERQFETLAEGVLKGVFGEEQL